MIVLFLFSTFLAKICTAVEVDQSVIFLEPYSVSFAHGKCL